MGGARGFAEGEVIWGFPFHDLGEWGLAGNTVEGIGGSMVKKLEKFLGNFGVGKGVILYRG